MAIIIVGNLENCMEKARMIATQLERGVLWKYRKVDLGDRWQIVMTPEFPARYPYLNASHRTRRKLRAGRTGKEELLNLIEEQ